MRKVFESVVKYVVPYRRRRESVVKYVVPYRRRHESVVKYVVPYRQRRESAVKYVVPSLSSWTRKHRKIHWFVFQFWIRLYYWKALFLSPLSTGIWVDWLSDSLMSF